VQKPGLIIVVGLSHQVMLCVPDARAEALEVLYQRVPDVLRYRLVLEVLHEAACGELDLSGLWIARKRTGRIVGALLTQHLVGKVAAIWAPEVLPSWYRAKLAAALVQNALVDLKAHGFQLAQAVLDESATIQAGRDLTRGGMPRITELLYLERDTITPLLGVKPKSRRVGLTGWSSMGSTFDWHGFEPALEADFRSVLAATYQGSLDMPELEGTRSLDDVMAGLHSTGRFVPGRWWLGRIPGKPEAAAILILAEIVGREAWEVVYLGLTPEARGYGLGRLVLAHALDVARPYTSRLELGVDARNKPAAKLYQSVGFVIRDRRAVHLALLDRPHQ
jgi:ribosomal protein S18 acetylase RimI-like enzyme